MSIAAVRALFGRSDKMARPCKPASVLTDKSQTKAEIAERDAIEKKLRGDKVKLTPPRHLNADQKKIFRKIVSWLKDSEVLGSADVNIIAVTAIAIDRISAIEQLVNDDPKLMLNTALMGTKDRYTKDFFRGCNELGLSPQSRAKFANIKASKKEDDPLMKILAASLEDDEEEDE